MKVYVVYHDMNVFGVYLSKQKALQRQEEEQRKQLEIRDPDQRQTIFTDETDIVDLGDLDLSKGFIYAHNQYETPHRIGVTSNPAAKGNQRSPIYEEPGFVVRLYDGFDNVWMDVSGIVSKEEADKIWNQKTKNGKEKTKYDDIDYYSIFPSDTVMLRRYEDEKSDN